MVMSSRSVITTFTLPEQASYGLSYGAIMRTERFMYFCIKKYIGTQGEVCRQLKIFLNLPIVYATDRSKAVVSVLFLFCVALWFLYYRRFMFVSIPVLFSSYFVIIFSIVITSLGEEGAGPCASRAFVCFVRVSFCHFSLPLGVGGWLHFVIVALFLLTFLDLEMIRTIIFLPLIHVEQLSVKRMCTKYCTLCSRLRRNSLPYPKFSNNDSS